MRLTVRVTPNAAADRIEGAQTDAVGRRFLQVRVRAVPEGGRANKAVEKLLAKSLGLAKSRVRVVTGATARIKGVDIDCADDSEAAHMIREWMADDRDTNIGNRHRS